MQKFPLGQLVKIKTGKLDANAKVDGGQYPFFTCSKDISRIDSYTYDCECVLVAGNGDLNVKYYNGKFDAYQRTYIIEDNKTQELDIKYLYYFMQSYIETLRSQTIGGVIQYIKLNNLTDIDFPLPPLSHQKQIIQKLDTLTNLINLRKLSIEKTEKLTKSIFIEMFGDPMINEKGWEVKKLEEVIIKLQAGKSLSGDDENIYKVLNTGSVSYDYFNGNDYKNLPKDYIPEEKNKVNISDLLISRMNTEELVGAAAYVFKIGDNIYLPDRLWRVKYDKNIINNLFLRQYIIQPIFKKDIRQISSGTSGSMKNISMENFLSLKIFLPPISLQNKFASIVEKNEENIRKQKESLKKLEELYSGIMQESFISP